MKQKYWYFITLVFLVGECGNIAAATSSKAVILNQVWPIHHPHCPASLQGGQHCIIYVFESGFHSIYTIQIQFIQYLYNLWRGASSPKRLKTTVLEGYEFTIVGFGFCITTKLTWDIIDVSSERTSDLYK